MPLFHNQKNIIILLCFADHPTKLYALQQRNTKPQKTEITSMTELVFTLYSKCDFVQEYLAETEDKFQNSPDT